MAAYPTAGLETVAEFGKRADASGATIVRFVSKLGYASYAEFQETLREELERTLESPLARYLAPDHRAREGNTLAQYADWAGLLLRQASEMVPSGEFDAVVELLTDDRRTLYLLGGRFSRSIAEIFAYGLSGIRNNVHLMAGDTRSLVQYLLMIRKRDVLVLLDFRRYQENLHEFARSARDAGATLVVVTDKWQSPCAGLAQHVFAIPVAGPSVYDSALAPVMCVEALTSRLAERIGERAKKRIASMEKLYERLTE